MLGFRWQGDNSVQLSSRRLKTLGQTVLHCAMRPLLLQVLVQASYPCDLFGMLEVIPRGMSCKLRHSPTRAAWIQPWASDAHTPPHSVGLWFCHALAPLEIQCCCPTLPSKVCKCPVRWYRHELWGWIPRASHPEYEPLPSRRRWGGSLFCELSALINLFKY